MGLKETQDILALLYTDNGFREHFFQKTSETMEKNDSPIGILKALNPNEVTYFARSLVRKHYHEAGSWMPWTMKALNVWSIEGLKLFQQYLQQKESYALTGPKQHALGFLDYLQHQAVIRQQPALKELARYERHHLLCPENSPFLKIRYFQYPLKPLVQMLQAGEISKEPKLGLCLAIWFKMPGSKTIRHRVLSPPSLPWW